jgi:hypothetical protein
MATTDAYEGLTTCASLVVMREAPKASPPGPTIEGETTLEAVLPKQRQRLATGALKYFFKSNVKHFLVTLEEQ